MQTEISDQIINKAVDIWCKLLHSPRFDNGDKSDNGALGMALALLNSSHAASSIDIEAAVEVFREYLTTEIKRMRDSGERFSPFLDVDYAPSKILCNAAEKAGIPTDLFSIKSSVYMCKDYVSKRVGYSAPDIKYYPYNGKWILAQSSLYGSERDEILKAIDEGLLTGFDIEDA